MMKLVKQGKRAILTVRLNDRYTVHSLTVFNYTLHSPVRCSSLYAVHCTLFNCCQLYAAFAVRLLTVLNCTLSSLQAI